MHVCLLFEAPLKIYWFIVIATRELLLLTFASCGANQSEACFLGEIWVKVESLSPLLHQTSKHIIFFLKLLWFNSYLYAPTPVFIIGPVVVCALVMSFTAPTPIALPLPL